ncbi:MAG: VOC family protein [Bryobacteraceae bacterium]
MSVTKIRHTGIVVSNMEMSLPFYRDLLGLKVWWDPIEEGPMVEAVTAVPGARIHTVKLKAPDGVSIELPHYLNTPRPVPPLNASNNVGCNHVALQVGDLDALYRKASAQGIRFHTPPTLAGGGKAKVTCCREPEGVIVELVEILA